MTDLEIKVDPFEVIHEDVISNILNLVHEGSDGRRDFLSVRLVSKRWKDHLDRCLDKVMSMRLTLDDFKQESLGFKLYQRVSFDSLKLLVMDKLRDFDSYIHSFYHLKRLVLKQFDVHPLSKEGSLWNLTGLKILKIHSYLEDVRCLSGLTSLESLQIKTPCEIPNNLTTLTKIEFMSSPFYVRYGHVGAFTNLVSLKMWFLQADELIAIVGGLPRLRQIRFDIIFGDITEREDRPLVLTKLEFPSDCYQRWNQWTYVQHGFTNWVQWLIRNSIELKELHWFCGSTDFTRIEIGHLTSLTRLSFDSKTDREFDVAKISVLTNLKRLSLGRKLSINSQRRQSILRKLPWITRFDIIDFKYNN